MSHACATGIKLDSWDFIIENYNARGYVWWLEPEEPQRQVQRLRLCQWSLYQVPVEPWCGYWWRTVKRDNGPVAFLDLSVCKWCLVNVCQKNGRALKVWEALCPRLLNLDCRRVCGWGTMS